jgi:hypothetical protein
LNRFWSFLVVFTKLSKTVCKTQEIGQMGHRNFETPKVLWNCQSYIN